MMIPIWFVVTELCTIAFIFKTLDVVGAPSDAPVPSVPKTTPNVLKTVMMPPDISSLYPLLFTVEFKQVSIWADSLTVLVPLTATIVTEPATQRSPTHPLSVLVPVFILSAMPVKVAVSQSPKINAQFKLVKSIQLREKNAKLQFTLFAKSMPANGIVGATPQ
jgi:hypothetical protein